MKHSILTALGATLLLYSSTPLLLTSCASKAPHNPITPIHLTGDTTVVQMTDYLPGCPNTVTLTGNELGIYQPTCDCAYRPSAVVTLPNLPVEQAMFTIGYQDKKVLVGFSKPVTNPKFVVMRDNTPLDSYTFDEANQTLTINLSAKRSFSEAVFQRSGLSSAFTPATGRYSSTTCLFR